MTLFGRKRADVMIRAFTVFSKAPFRAFGELVVAEGVDKAFDVLHDVYFPLADMPVSMEVGVAFEIESATRFGGLALDDGVNDCALDVVVGKKLAECPIVADHLLGELEVSEKLWASDGGGFVVDDVDVRVAVGSSDVDAS